MRKDIQLNTIPDSTFDLAEITRQRASAIFAVTEGFEGASEELLKSLYELRDRVDLIRQVQRHELSQARAKARAQGIRQDPGGADPRLCPEHGEAFTLAQEVIACIDHKDIVIPAEEELFWHHAMSKKRETASEEYFRKVVLDFLARRGQRSMTAREAFTVLGEEFFNRASFSNRESGHTNAPLTNID